MPRNVTASGRFAVVRDEGVLYPVHVPTGLRCGAFSHLAVRTFKQAIAGLEDVEAATPAIYLQAIDKHVPVHVGECEGETLLTALSILQTNLRNAFPNGAWSR